MNPWDSHPACRSCLSKAGIVACSRTSRCECCHFWTKETWVKFDQAMAHAATKHASHSFSTGQDRTAPSVNPSNGSKLTNFKTKSVVQVI